MLSILNFQIKIYPGSNSAFSHFIFILSGRLSWGGSFFAISHFTTLRGTWRGVLNQGGWEIYAKLRENDIAPEKKHSSHLTILKMQHSHQITQYSTHSSIQATTSKSMNRLSASAMEPNKILRSNTFI